MRLGSAWPRAAFSDLDEPARDAAARTLAALSDGHLERAFRHYGELHELVVPRLDAATAQRLKESEPDARAVSAVVGLVGLWRELPDIDLDRESIVEIIALHAARDEVPEDERTLLTVADSRREAQREWLLEVLRAEGVPVSHWWRRLLRTSKGGLGDRATVQVRRGPLVIAEREPPEQPAPLLQRRELEVAAMESGTDLGIWKSGDRLSLRWHVDAPGRIAVLHAAVSGSQAELSIVLPAAEAELSPRRIGELVEVEGLIESVPGTTEHAMVVVWLPEVVPAHYLRDILVRRRLPPESRVWLYRYRVVD